MEPARVHYLLNIDYGKIATYFLTLSVRTLFGAHKPLSLATRLRDASRREREQEYRSGWNILPRDQNEGAFRSVGLRGGKEPLCLVTRG